VSDANRVPLPMRGTGVFVTSDELAELQVLVEKAVREERGEACPCCGAPPMGDPGAAWHDAYVYGCELATRHGFPKRGGYGVTPDGEIYLPLIQ